MSADCLICAAEDADESTQVFRDDLWAADVVSGYEVPGWVVLRARRHAVRVTGLDANELATYGTRLQDTVAAVVDATGIDVVYQVVFGENYPHFHVLITPRGEDVEPADRGGAILSRRTDWLDPEGARALVPKLREAYLAHAGASQDTL